MKAIWKLFWKLSALSGMVLIVCSVSLSDYYVLEMGMDEPSFIWRNLVIGALLLAPMMVQVLIDLAKEGC